MARVLVVDDSEDSRLLLGALLKKAGVQSETAVDGRAALERLERAWAEGPAGAFELVLLDMQMPVLDGFETVRALRERERAPGGPPRSRVVAMTAYDREEDRARISAAGCDGLLAKPVRRDELARLLATLGVPAGGPAPAKAGA